MHMHMWFGLIVKTALRTGRPVFALVIRLSFLA